MIIVTVILVKRLINYTGFLRWRCYKTLEMEKHVLEEVSKLQSEQNVLGVLVSDTKGLCIFSSGEVTPGISGHVTFIANQLSKLDKHDLYPTIVLKSDNKSCLLKGCENSCVYVLYQNK